MASLATRALAGWLALQSPIFSEYTAVDPTTGAGLQRPVGWRVLKPDGSTAWDKTGAGATQWSVIGTGVGGVSTFNGSAGAVLFHPMSSVANATALAALTSTTAAGFFDGCEIYDVAHDCLWLMQTSALATNPMTVINCLGNAGHQWVRKLAQSTLWQAQTTWHINNGGSDDSATTTIATAAELHRRLYGANCGTVTINVDNDMASADAMIFDNVTGTITVQGVINVTNTLTVASAQARDPTATNHANEITCTGFDFSGLIGTLLRVQGTNNYAAIVKAPSLGVARLGELWNTITNSQASATGVGAGATVETVNQTRGATTLRINGGRITYVEVDIKRTAGFTLNITSGGPLPIFSRCPVSGGTVNLNAPQLNIQCSPWNNAALVCAIGMVMLLDAPAFTGTGAIALQGILVIVRAAFYQGKGFTFSDGLMYEQKGDCGIFDLPNGGIGMSGTNMARFANVSGGQFYGGGNDAGSTGVKLASGTTGFYATKATWVANMGNGVNTAAGNTAFAALPLALATADGTAFYGA